MDVLLEILALRIVVMKKLDVFILTLPVMIIILVLKTGVTQGCVTRLNIF